MDRPAASAGAYPDRRGHAEAGRAQLSCPEPPMTDGYDTLLPAASVMGHKVDVLFYVLLGLTGSVALAITVLIVAFTIRYRRGAKVDRSNPPTRLRWLEVTWIATPFAIFL